MQAEAQIRRKSWSRRKTIIVVLTSIVALFVAYRVVFILFVVFVAQPVKIEGVAMSPTLNHGDRVFLGKNVNKLSRGDIVVFHFPLDTDKSFIKRIVGLPGETIRMDKDGQLYINGNPMDEPYLAFERNRSPRVIPEQTIKPDHYFVMGDNRDASNDSRSWGLVPKNLIYGKVIWRYWPISGDVQ
ncbi:MAG TPA: signal peptidase I [Blastocatellia bacterium]|nr:signal peptidase I [Blastocatellia bacterium]